MISIAAIFMKFCGQVVSNKNYPLEKNQGLILIFRSLFWKKSNFAFLTFFSQISRFCKNSKRHQSSSNLVSYDSLRLEESEISQLKTSSKRPRIHQYVLSSILVNTLVMKVHQEAKKSSFRLKFYPDFSKLSICNALNNFHWLSRQLGYFKEFC